MERETGEWLTEQETAEMTGLSVSKLQRERFMKRGIPFTRFGKSVRYRKDDIIKFMKKGVIFFEVRQIPTRESLDAEKACRLSAIIGKFIHENPGKTSESISRATRIRLYTVRRILRGLLDLNEIERRTHYYEPHAFTWLYFPVNGANKTNQRSETL